MTLSFQLESLYIGGANFLVIKLATLNLHIIAVYRPHPVDITFFCNEIDRLLGLYANSYVVGDFNINLRNGNDEDVRSYLRTIHVNGFSVLNSLDELFYTRLHFTSIKTVIDHFITDRLTHSYHLSLQDISMSDHRLLYLFISTRRSHMSRPSIKTVIDHTAIGLSPLWETVAGSTLGRFLTPSVK